MSYELRAPMNAIIGFSDLVADEGAGPLVQKQTRFVGRIRPGAHHLLQIINDIVDIAKIEAGRVPECGSQSEAISRNFPGCREF
jgi:signal transduction histidine kinase